MKIEKLVSLGFLIFILFSLNLMIYSEQTITIRSSFFGNTCAADVERTSANNVQI